MAKDVQMFDWNGEPLPVEQRGPGEYQLLLRISNIYFGQHGSTPYMASAQVRVAQIRFRPLNAALCPKPLPMCLLKDEDTRDVIFVQELTGSKMDEDTYTARAPIPRLNVAFDSFGIEPPAKVLRKSKKLQLARAPTLLPTPQQINTETVRHPSA